MIKCIEGMYYADRAAADELAERVTSELGAGAMETLEALLSAMDSDTEADLMMYIARCWGIDVSDLDIQED